MIKAFKRMSSARLVALGFASVILIGSLLLKMPFCIRDGVTLKYIDALYTSTTAVCVTGLVTVDIGDTFTVAGRTVICLLVQIGGLGVASVGAGIIVAMRKKMGTKERTLVKEASNLYSSKGVVKFVKNVFLTTIVFEFFGAVLLFFTFIKDYPLKKTIGLSVFHSVSAFNNAGLDVLGNFQSLSAYKEDVFFNIITALLIILGGLGFLVIREVFAKKFRWKKFSMHTKVVLSTTAILIIGGTVLFKLTENISWIGAFFNSVTARTAGFSTYSIGGFSNAGLLIMMILIVIGASPGSTGGGIKTTTFFTLFQGIKFSATNKSEKAFKYSLPEDSFRKASVITITALFIILTGTALLTVAEPDITLRDALFETSSAFGTAGLSTGITPTLCTGSKILCILIMFIGRLGPMTAATLWYFNKGERVRYPEGNISIG